MPGMRTRRQQLQKLRAKRRKARLRRQEGAKLTRKEKDAGR
jgi:hypothetical protein